MAIANSIPQATPIRNELAVSLPFVLKRFLRWNHEQVTSPSSTRYKPVGDINLIADGVHNLVEGLMIGASYLAGVEIRLPIAWAVIFYEIPHELGNFFALLYARFSKTKILGFRLLSEAAVISRIVLTLFIGSRVNRLK